MSSFKQTAKACLKPIYRRMPTPLQAMLRNLRNSWRDLPFPSANESEQPLLSYMKESDRILLALLKSTHMAARGADTPSDFRAVALGNDRLLVPHPALEFMYLHARDVAVVPPVVLNRYETGVQRALERLGDPGAVVLEARARHGFHTLSMARHVTASGRVYAHEADPALRDVLHDNLTAHHLHSVVEILPASASGQAFPSAEVLARLGRTPDLIRLDVGDQIGPAIAAVLGLLMSHPDTRLLLTLPAGTAAFEPLRQLAEQQMRFWEVRDDGALEERKLVELHRVSEQERLDLLVARSPA